MVKEVFPVYNICSLSDYKQEDILISRFAPYLQVHKDLHLAHKHTFYHLVLFTEGAGTHTIDFETFAVKPFQLYFMVPGQVHSWAFQGKADGYVINFSVSFFQSLLLKPDYLEQFSFFSGMAGDAVIDLSKQAYRQVKELFEMLVQETQRRERLAPDMVRALMLQLFILVSRLGSERPDTPSNAYNYTLPKSFQKLIEKNFSTLKLPKSYAALLYITPNHLNALCSDILSVSAGELIRARITLEAKRLLVNKELSISEIASQLNFKDNSYFTKFYKKRTGLTPEEFRKQALVLPVIADTNITNHKHHGKSI